MGSSLFSSAPNRTRTGSGIALALTGLAALLNVGLAHAQERSRIESGPSGLGLVSGDEAWQLRLRGLLQVDGRVFADGP